MDGVAFFLLVSLVVALKLAHWIGPLILDAVDGLVAVWTWLKGLRGLAHPAANYQAAKPTSNPHPDGP